MRLIVRHLPSIARGLARRSSDHSLLGQLDLVNLLAGSHHVLVLDTHDTTAPLSEEISIIVVLGLEGVGEAIEVDEVFVANLRESNARSSLHVDELAEVGFATDEAEGDALLSAERGQVDDDLKRVDVVGNHDKLGLVLFNESGNVVQTELNVDGLASLLSVLLSGGLQSVSLLGLGLRLVLCEQFKELGSYVS